MRYLTNVFLHGQGNIQDARGLLSQVMQSFVFAKAAHHSNGSFCDQDVQEHQLSGLNFNSIP